MHLLHMMSAIALSSSLVVCCFPAAEEWDAQRLYTAYRDGVVFISVETVDHSGTEQGKKVHTGTGFIINTAGYVLTNSHVVPARGAAYKSVSARGVTRSRFSQLSPQKLDVIDRHPEQDLVLLKFPDTGQTFTPVVIGDPQTSNMERGEVLFTMGFPLDDDLASTKGSLLNKNAERGRWLTDLNVTYGNSGGPVFNKDGVVVAVVVGGVLGSTVNRYVIPIQYARQLIEAAGGHGRRHGWLGLHVAHAEGPDRARGVLVRYVNQGGPAERVGIQPGDVITAIGGQAIRDAQELVEMQEKLSAGKAIEVEIFRKGNRQRFTMTLDEIPEARAQYYTGLKYYRGWTVPQDSNKAVRWFQKGAAQGDPRAQFYLGWMYAKGEGGLSKDPQEAVRWLRKAADQGDTESQAYLVVMYVEGAGVPQDAKEAVKWSRKAAEQGEPRSQHFLGWAYANGWGGLPKDPQKAEQWYRKAAAQGHTNAQKALEELLRR